MSTVLIVAYHFPPLRGSSGIQRTLRFCRYLPEFGWEPVVITAHPRAYEETSTDLMGELPRELPITRAFALNAASHLSFRGRYPNWLAVPDRWSSWFLGGVVAGMAAIRRHRVRAIFSTYPIATAHLIGLALSRLSGLPWIADFRDPMAQDGYPEDPLQWKSFRWIEERTLRRAARATFTSPSAIRDYQRRYPDIPRERFVLIENGYDEEAFTGLTLPAMPTDGDGRRRLVLLHSGVVYPSERDPTQLFQALRMLKDRQQVDASTVEFRFRASGNDGLLAGLATQHGVSDLVSLLPPIPYRDALTEMCGADALLVMQAANCNSQIPAKVYEYLRARRPLLTFTDAMGDTADLIRRAGIGPILPLDSASAIAAALPAFLADLRAGTVPIASDEFAQAGSRRARTQQLSVVLNEIA